MPLKLISPAEAPGKRSFYVRGSYLGVSVFRSARTDRAKIAAAELKRIEREIEAGRYSEPTGPAPPTFADAAIGYLKECSQAEVKKIERLLKPLHAKLLTEFDKDLIDETEEVLFPGRFKNFAAGTLNREFRSPLAAVLHHAAKRKKMPWLVVEKYKEEARNSFLEPEQALRLIRAARSVDHFKERHRNARLAPLLVFLFSTGARISEACRLTWADVDLDRRHVVLRNTKNGETYGVHLGEAAFIEMANLPGLRHPNAKVFGFRDRHAVKYSLRRARISAKLPDFTLHWCRHSFATWLRRNGEDLKKMMELGRWKDVKSVIRYQHVASHEHAPAIAALPINPPQAKRHKRAGKKPSAR